MMLLVLHLVVGEATPTAYGALLGTTTLAYKPAGAPVAGPPPDLSPAVGLGYLATETLSLELDFSPTFTRDGYVAAAFVPGVVWSAHPNAYLAMRVLCTVDPEAAVALLPGVGGIVVLESGVAPVVELDALLTRVGGKLDVGATLTAGVLVFF